MLNIYVAKLPLSANKKSPPFFGIKNTRKMAEIFCWLIAATWRRISLTKILLRKKIHFTYFMPKVKNCGLFKKLWTLSLINRAPLFIISIFDTLSALPSYT